MAGFPRCCTFALACGLLALAELPVAPLSAQAASSLETQLESMYKLTVVDTDGTVASPGTLLMVVHGGLTTSALHNGVLCPQIFHDGKLDPPGRMCRMSQQHLNAGEMTPMLGDGAAVQITKMTVDSTKDVVRFDLIDSPADPKGNVMPSTRKASLLFQFPKGYLAKADAGQVADLVGQELQTATNSASAGAQAGPPIPGPAAASAGALPATKSVRMGMTPEEVTSVLGPPTTVAVAGSKTVWICAGGLKITFQNGHVTDFQ